MMLASGDFGIEQIINLFNQIIAKNKVPEDWNTSVIMNCFKNLGKTNEQENYIGG